MEGVSGSKNSHMTIILLALDSGVTVEVLDYGASLYSFIVPDKERCLDDILLGQNQPLDTLEHHCFFSASVGRYANRIAKTKFSINDQDYRLVANE